MMIILGLIILIALLLICLLISTQCVSNKEEFAGFSSYRHTGRRNKKICKDYYIDHYLDCIKRSGGIDVQGNCWNRIRPHMIACDFNDF